MKFRMKIISKDNCWDFVCDDNETKAHYKRCRGTRCDDCYGRVAEKDEDFGLLDHDEKVTVSGTSGVIIMLFAEE